MQKLRIDKGYGHTPETKTQRTPKSVEVFSVFFLYFPTDYMKYCTNRKSQSTNKRNTSTTISHTQQFNQKRSTRSTRQLRCKALKLCKWTMGTTTATPPPSTQIAINNQAQHINHKTKQHQHDNIELNEKHSGGNLFEMV